MKLQDLPETEKLWRVITKRDQFDVKRRKAKRGVFKDRRGSLSVDLARFSTRTKTLRGYSKARPFPEGAGLVEVTVGQADLCGASVRHSPINTRDEPGHYCHCQFGNVLVQDQEIKLAELADVLIPPSETLR